MLFEVANRPKRASLKTPARVPGRRDETYPVAVLPIGFDALGNVQVNNSAEELGGNTYVVLGVEHLGLC